MATNTGADRPSLLAQAADLLAELNDMGVQVVPGMPVPGDDEHARMAVHVLSAMVHAHKTGRHTAYCTCALRRPDDRSNPDG